MRVCGPGAAAQLPKPLRAPLAALVLTFAAAAPASPELLTRTVGQLTIQADSSLAYQGGLLVVRLHSRRYLGGVSAILEGRRVPFQPTPRGLRALVPVPVTAAAGPHTLGIELRTRRGKQRIALEVAVAPRSYAPRSVTIPEQKRALLKRPDSHRDGRLLLQMLRTETPQAQWTGALRPPVSAPPLASFGAAQTYLGGSPVEMMTDALFGEYHRGLDYEVPRGTVIQAPGSATVLHAGPLALTGETLVLDHGQGLVSVLYHLSRIDVRTGDAVDARAPLGLSGDTGLAATPHVHWGTYVHGVAVDPEALQRLTE